MKNYIVRLSVDLEDFSFGVHLGHHEKSLREERYPIPDRGEILALVSGTQKFYVPYKMEMVELPKEFFRALDTEIMAAAVVLRSSHLAMQGKRAA